jgi:hypothetical protein
MEPLNQFIGIPPARPRNVVTKPLGRNAEFGELFLYVQTLLL